MRTHFAVTRRNTLFVGTTLAAVSALGSQTLGLAPSPADAQTAADTRGDDRQYVFERGFPTPETARRAHDERDY